MNTTRHIFNSPGLQITGLIRHFSRVSLASHEPIMDELSHNDATGLAYVFVVYTDKDGN